MIICAALKIQVEGLDHTTIVPCIRHGDGFQILEDLGYALKTKYKVLEQGFVTHDNKFLNRAEAFKYVTCLLSQELCGPEITHGETLH